MRNGELWHRRHRDFEWIDRIELKVVPRYKTSELSGDEWRQHVQVDCYFKGLLVLSFGARDMVAAVGLIPARVFYNDEGASKEYLDREMATCDQPSCPNEPTVFLKPKRLTARDGSYLDPSESNGYYRKFCEAHRERGDCAREDADSNYEKIADPRKAGPK